MNNKFLLTLEKANFVGKFTVIIFLNFNYLMYYKICFSFFNIWIKFKSGALLELIYFYIICLCGPEKTGFLIVLRHQIHT